jgi:hypothetical protein
MKVPGDRSIHPGLHAIPDLTVRALAIPAEIAVGNRVYRKVLKTSKQTVSGTSTSLPSTSSYQLLGDRADQRLFLHPCLASALIAHRQRQ